MQKAFHALIRERRTGGYHLPPEAIAERVRVKGHGGTELPPAIDVLERALGVVARLRRPTTPHSRLPTP